MMREQSREQVGQQATGGAGGVPASSRLSRSLARTFASFSNRNYRLFWFGQLLSVTGTWVQRVAQAWLVLNLTDSSFALGMVTTLQFLPMTLFSLFGGVFADRLPKRQVLLVTQFVMGIQALILGLLISWDVVEIWHIYILAAVLGLATAFDNPTRQAFVVEMVGPKNVPNAVALNSSLFNTARIVGPSIGGAMIAAFGIAVPFYANAVSFVAVIVGLLMMRPEEFHDVPPPVRGPVLARLREGIAYSVRTPAVALVLILMAFLGTFGYQFTVILPLIARYVLDTGALGFGGLLTAMGIGSLVAALGVAYVSSPTERLLLMGAGSFTVLLGLLALSTSAPLTVGILVLLGAGSIVFTATANSRLQILAPGELRGRVMSLYIFLFMGTAPVGSLSLGYLAETLSVRIAVGIMALLCAVGFVLGWLYRARHPEHGPRTATRRPVQESSVSD
jgi:MFS family permease